MSLFETGRLLHGSVGIIALACFWIAALAVKGSRLHRRAGRVYLLSMLAIMAISGLMVLGKAFQEKNPAMAVYILFLISMVGTASWLMWFAVRRKRDPAHLTGSTYRALATLLIVAGVAMFFVTWSIGRPIGMFLSLLGTGFGINMWRLVLFGGRNAGAWLGHHMNGAMLNFIATHDSFIALGIGSVVPELRLSVPRMLIAATLTVVGVGLRVGYGRRAARRHVARAVQAAPGQPGRAIP